MSAPRVRSSGSRAPSKTTIVSDTDGEDPSDGSAQITILVIAWCAHEPDRLGEIAIVPDAGDGLVLGRDDEKPTEALRFFRLRPNGMAPTPPLGSVGISRRQLLVEANAHGARIERLGKCVLEVNGQRCDVAMVRPGDVVYLRRELVLFCARRPARIPPSKYFPRDAVGVFGRPDALGILGESPGIWNLRERIAFAAKADTHVLLVGGSGTGKELAAHAIHALSPRSPRPLVARNAATLPAGLIDAELFGNARNYPNAGMPERAGLVGSADGGFLFLDEIGELPAELQAHLLRVLDRHGEYQRLGEAAPRRSDFRLLAATNRDPSSLKHDLLARLTARLEIPSLDTRREDTPLLVRHLLLRAAERSPAIAERFIERQGEAPQARVAPALIQHLLRRTFAANTRELDAVLWHAMSESTGDIVELPASLRPQGQGTALRLESPAQPGPEQLPVVEPTADEIRASLAREGGVAQAARALGLSSRYVLYRLLDKHGIARPRPAEES